MPSALGQLPINGAPAFPNLLYKPAARREHSETFNSLVGRLVADYQFSEALRGYASFSRGRRPNVIDVDASSVTIVDDEIVLSSEIGLKGIAAQGRLGWDLALFHYDYSNFQTMVRDDQSLRYVAANGGNASALGGEFSLSWRASERFNAFFNYGFVDATFDDRDDNGNVQELAGNRFRLTPRHSAAAGAEWVLPQGNRQWYLRPSVSWRSHVYFEDDNTAGIEQDSYALVNLKAGVRLADGRWDIGVWANNLADEKFLIDGGNTGRLFGSPTFIQGAPRMYGLTLSGRF